MTTRPTRNALFCEETMDFDDPINQASEIPSEGNINGRSVQKREFSQAIYSNEKPDTRDVSVHKKLKTSSSVEGFASPEARGSEFLTETQTKPPRMQSLFKPDLTGFSNRPSSGGYNPPETPVKVEKMRSRFLPSADGFSNRPSSGGYNPPETPAKAVTASSRLRPQRTNYPQLPWEISATPNFDDVLSEFTLNPKEPQNEFFPEKAGSNDDPALFIQRNQELSRGVLRYNDQNFAVRTIINTKGNFLQPYCVSDEGAPSVIPGIANDEILVKCFHSRRIRQSSKRLVQFCKNSLSQYKALKEMKLSVAEIFNNPLEDGFYLVKKIPFPVTTTAWAGNQPLETLPQEAKSQLQQVRLFLETTVRHKTIQMDLKPDNFRLDTKNTIFLVDFKETSEDEDELKGEHLSSVLQALRLWSSDNEAVFNYLTSTLQDIDPAFYQELRRHY